MVQELNIENLSILYSTEQVGQLDDILDNLIANLDGGVGKLKDEADTRHLVSWFRRYEPLKKVLTTDANQLMKARILAREPMKFADFSFGNGMAVVDLMHEQLSRDVAHDQREFSLHLYDTQVPESMPERIRYWFDEHGMSNLPVHIKKRDITQGPDTSTRFNLGIIGNTHFYLSEAEFRYAVAARLIECDVLYIAPATARGNSDVDLLDGMFLYMKSGEVQAEYCEVDTK